jgi:hypothetical protein
MNSSKSRVKNAAGAKSHLVKPALNIVYRTIRTARVQNNALKEGVTPRPALHTISISA